MKTHRNYVLASLEVQLVDAQAITVMMDENDNHIKAMGANICLVSDGQLITPTDRKILWG